MRAYPIVARLNNVGFATTSMRRELYAIHQEPRGKRPRHPFMSGSPERALASPRSPLIEHDGTAGNGYEVGGEYKRPQRPAAASISAVWAMARWRWLLSGHLPKHARGGAWGSNVGVWQRGPRR